MKNEQNFRKPRGTLVQILALGTSSVVLDMNYRIVTDFI